MSLAAGGPPPVPPSSAAKIGVKGALLWLALEFVTRYVTIFGLVAILLETGWSSASRLKGPDAITVNAIGVAVAMVILGVAFARRVHRERIGLPDLGYRFSWSIVLAGLIAGGVLFGLLELTHFIDTRVFEPRDILRAIQWTEAEELKIVAEAGLVAAIIMLPANGILAPFVEEFAWRGYIQSRLTQGWGARTGLIVTALLFAAKHMVVDISYARLSSLLVGSFVLGLVRHRWGTGASTVTHLALNLTGTLRYFIVAARLA